MRSTHPEILATQELVYKKSNLKFTGAEPEAESEEYGAHTFGLENFTIKFRVAKITPKKIGQFVTCWKRTTLGPIQPFDIEDSFDFLVVSVRSGENFGQFVFPKAVLSQKGIIAKLGKGGKRAMRVYPPWDQTTSQQAQKTQKWQCAYFLEIPSDEKIDVEHAKHLYLNMAMPLRPPEKN